MTAVPAETQTPYTPAPLRHRFRKAWRSVFFVAIVPFFSPNLITSILPFSVPTEVVVFASGVLVLFPLSTFIEVVTEDLIERAGQLVGGLLHAFFGNIAYFVLTASALITAASVSAEKRNEIIGIVQSSIAGTIVIDILFILGISIFIGGVRNGRMQFSAEYSNQYAEMLTVAVIALALPTLAQRFSLSVSAVGAATTSISGPDVAKLSDLTAIILIIAYFGYIGWTVFKLGDRPAKPEEDQAQVDADLRGDEIGPLAAAAAADEEARQREQLAAAETLRRSDTPAEQAAAARAEALAAAGATPAAGSPIAEIVNARIARQLEEQGAKRGSRAANAATAPRRGLAFWEICILVAGTGGVVFISENMAHVFENGQLTSHLGLNPFFVGFILLPVVSNLVELSASVSTAFHNRMETCLAVTAGSAIQVALLIAPLLVLVGHLSGLTNMNLIFGPFVLAVFALIAYLFQLVTVDGETTWLEGLQFTSFFAVLVTVALLAG
jgi:Ca2+:H+ antiporter